MNRKIIYRVLIVGLVVLGCTERFELKTETFEDRLVIEATITNEVMSQEIKISRTHVLESTEPNYEHGATVKIEDSNQNTYSFTDEGDGLYVSTIPFMAEAGVSYKLFVETLDGRKFESSQEQLVPLATIDNLYAELIDVDGVSGIQVLADTNENLGEAQFFRYEYEETYKIVAPFYTSYDALITNLVVSPSLSYDIELVPRPQEQKICYSTHNSEEILLDNVNGLAASALKKVPIRFIPIEDPILRDRYSILVKQYVQSANAYNFYKILRDLGSDGSIFLDNQPGFIQGNIVSSLYENDNAIGFFDVSSVSSKRIYFNYLDFGIDKPPYFYDCEVILWDYLNTGPEINERYYLYQNLTFDDYIYASVAGYEESVYGLTTPHCGNCTTFSSGKKPEFWED
ncbi:DUF4249 domain-containing protein [Snuella lapsa]|uniref:DUF4249 domain-containing protein n=1 Tax=Snuella lapsa TaxID=870481 RepID=A0ABP6XEA1_9FLAO